MIKWVKCGNFAICDLTYKLTKVDKYNLIVTNFDKILWLKDESTYDIICEGKPMKVHFCEALSLDDVEILTGKNFSSEVGSEQIPEVDMIKGRCIGSMGFLDQYHRDYVNNYKFKSGDIMAVKSVAGSGKTTTLINLAKKNKNKSILYLAFNKKLIEEIRTKSPPNLEARTFDSILSEVFIHKTNITPDIIDVKPYTIGRLIPWLSTKAYKLKKYYTDKFTAFCNQSRYDNIVEFCRVRIGDKKPMLTRLWEDALLHRFHSFDTIRKICEVKHLCKDYLDDRFHMIFVDETQDFDEIMLNILLRDTTIPKVFVGDHMQAIYQWRGCINAFDRLPPRTKFIEFYKSFRVGNPACNEIRKKFPGCWMISGAKHETRMLNYIEPGTKYTYLFRSWRGLFEAACKTKNIWINDFDKQVSIMKDLAGKLKKFSLTEEEKASFSDDLPAFIMSLGSEKLNRMIDEITLNMVPKDACICEMYTIHAYKGLESDVVKLHNDIDNDNIHYVALTRGIKGIKA